MLKHGVALVITSSEYDDNILDLPCCKKDGVDMERALNSIGFDVFAAVDLNRNDLLQKITDFIDSMELYETVLLYYTGHGMQIEGKNYVIPKDTRLTHNKDVLIRASLIDLDLIVGSFGKNPYKTNIAILDACRDNPFASKGFRSKGLAEMNAGAGTLISYATSPDSTSVGYTSEKVNSLFTKHLLVQMTKPNLKIEDMFKLVRIGVESETYGEQVPWENTSLKKDFYFVMQDDEVIKRDIYIGITNTIDEGTTLATLSDKYSISILNVLLRYHYYKMNLPGGIYMGEIEMHSLVLKRVLDLGYIYRSYRWSYAGKSVRMGEFLHSVPTIDRHATEIVMNYNLIKNNANSMKLIVTTNAPENMKFGCSLSISDVDFYRTKFASVVNGQIEFILNVGENTSLCNMQLSVQIFSLATSQQPDTVNDFIGIDGKNITGEIVQFDSLNSYRICSNIIVFVTDNA